MGEWKMESNRIYWDGKDKEIKKNKFIKKKEEIMKNK